MTTDCRIIEEKTYKARKNHGCFGVNIIHFMAQFSNDPQVRAELQSLDAHDINKGQVYTNQAVIDTEDTFIHVKFCDKCLDTINKHKLYPDAIVADNCKTLYGVPRGRIKNV